MTRIHRTILVTGGTGFFGRALLRYWLDNDESSDQIFILTRDPAKFLASYPALAPIPQIKLIQGDIQNRFSLPWKQSFTHVLHAATDSTLGPRLTPLQRFNQIVEGTTNILDLAVATGASRFLLTSSGGIYGAQPPDLPAIPETWLGAPLLADPNTAYSQAKRAAEHLCTLYQDAKGLETVVARCFAFVGPDLPLDVHFAIGNFINDALYNDVISVQGNGSPLRTYLDQSDLAHWLWTLLVEGKAGEAYNVGSNEVVSIADLAYLVRDLVAPGKPVVIHGQPNPAAARNRYVPAISKAADLHALKVTISLADAILRTAESHRTPSSSESCRDHPNAFPE